MARTTSSKTLSIVPSSGAEAFAAVQAEIDAITDRDLVPISVDITFAHLIVLGAAEAIDPLLPVLARLPGYDIERVRRIRLYAAACRHAHLLATSPEEADPRFPAVLQEAVALRGQLLASAKTLAQFGHVAHDRVEAIRKGAGHIDTANDLDFLAMLFSELPDALLARTLVTKPMIDRAPVLAHQMHTLLGIRRLEPYGAPDPQRTRQRAFTLLVRVYDECRRGVAFVRAPHADAERITPSLYLKQRRRPAKTTAEPSPNVDPGDGVVPPT